MMADEKYTVGKGAVHASSRHGVDEATLASFPRDWKFHYGALSSLGNFDGAGGREAVITWEEGGASRKQGSISDAQWEILKLAFQGNGKIAVLSDKTGIDWMFDYRFLEVSR
jgi:hypothetical protein